MAYRWLGILWLAAALAAGCADDGSRARLGGGGTAGAGGVGGEAGTGGQAGDTGTGGFQYPKCIRSVLCPGCPTEVPCDTDQECGAGFVCIDTGCQTLEGAPLKQCVFSGGGACVTNDDCPPERECVEVAGEGMRCVKTTPGCTTDLDCVSGFLCESGTCVDRRLPCFFDEDCPKSHLCGLFGAARFCARMHQTCVNEFDCAGLATHCADIDGDTVMECAGVFDPNAPLPQVCVNTLCSGETPVCEVGAVSTVTECGQYGLCLIDDDCANGFECVALWNDGRKECVETGGECASLADCPIQQVCASPRSGGPPACQAGATQ